MLFHQMPMPKKVLLNIKGPPLVNMISDLQIVFMDMACSQCIDCMERAIKAYTKHNHAIKTVPSTDELHAQVLRLRKRYRNKRDSETSFNENTTVKTKRNKSKKKTSKSVTVTKYNVDGVVFALKVKETNTVGSADQQNDNQVSTCQIFSVKKSFPCDTPDSDSFLTVAKRKVSKKSKKEKKAHATTTTKPYFVVPAFKKRQIDNSQIPDNFMPSIEDFY